MRHCPKKYPYVYGNNKQKQGLVPKESIGDALNNISMKNRPTLNERSLEQVTIGPSLISVNEAQGQGNKVSGNKVKQNDVNDRLNHVDLCTTRKAQNVVFGPILVNLILATV
jgi:hypothetical protein